MSVTRVHALAVAAFVAVFALFVVVATVRT